MIKTQKSFNDLGQYLAYLLGCLDGMEEIAKIYKSVKPWAAGKIYGSSSMNASLKRLVKK